MGIFKSEAEKTAFLEIRETRPSSTSPKIELLLGDAVLKYAEQSIVQTIATRGIEAVEKNDNKELQDLLERSEFNKILPQNERALFNSGESVVALYYLGDMPYIHCFEYNAITTQMLRVGQTVYSFEGILNSKNYNYDSREYNIQSWVKYVNINADSMLTWHTGRYPSITKRGIYQILDYRIVGDDKKEVPDERLRNNILRTFGKYTDVVNLSDLGHSIVPVAYFSNTDMPTSDYESVRGIIEHLNFYSKEFITEYQYGVKTMYSKAVGYDGSKTSNTLAKEIEGGARVIADASGPNGNVQNGITQINSGGNGIVLLTSLTQLLEDKALKFMLTLRDSTSTGNNKQTTEIVTFNQAATEYALFKIKRFRNFQWKYFFGKIVAEAIKGLKLEMGDFELKISKMEENKIKSGDPEINAKANNGINNRNKSNESNNTKNE